MNETLNLAPAVIAGILLGATFFGGLWWTVQRGMASSHAAFWFFGSMLLRTGLALIGFYLVADGSWQRLLATLAGFVVARLVVTRLARVVERPGRWVREAGHAP